MQLKTIPIQSKDIKFIHLNQIKPNPKNRNKHTKEQIDRLCKIIEYQGFRSPLIISNRSGLLVSGHGRLEAAKKLKLESVPVIYQDFEDEDQEYAAGVSENSIASWAELDLSGINEDIANLGPDFDLDYLGIENFTLDASEKGLCDPDEIPEKVEPKTKLGDIYQLGNHRLMCGSSVDPQAMDLLMDSEIADLLVTDPPYGVSYVEKNAAVNGGIVKNAIGKEIKNDTGSVEEMGKLWADLFSMSQYFSDEASYYVFSPQGGELMMMMMMMMMMQAIHQSEWQLKHSLIWAKHGLLIGLKS